MAKQSTEQLKKKADELGLSVPEDIKYDDLALAVKEAEAALEADKKSVQLPSNVQMTPEMLAMMARMMAEQMSKSVGPKTDARGQFREEDIDPDDMGDEVLFYAHRIFHIVSPKSVNGVAVQMPYGIRVVKFKLLYGITNRSGKQEEVSYVSVYSTRSKKMQAYLRTHPEYGRLFFENPKDVSDLPEQARRATVFGRHMALLLQLTTDKLYNRARNLGITPPHNASIADVRALVADAETDREFANRDKWQVRFNEEQERNKMLLEGMSTIG